jgi:hypothetical protein
MLEPFGLPLVGAVEVLVECHRLLGVVPLLTAARDYLARSRGFETGLMVPRAVGELIELKKQDRVSSQYIASLTGIRGD